jgi:hypothetical protein
MSAASSQPVIKSDPTSPPQMLEIEAICRETRRAIRQLKRWGDAPPSKNCEKTQGKPLSQRQVRRLQTIVESYRRVLVRVAKAPQGHKQRARVDALILKSLAAKVCAVLRALSRFERYEPLEQILKLARQIHVSS